MVVIALELEARCDALIISAGGAGWHLNHSTVNTTCSCEHRPMPGYRIAFSLSGPRIIPSNIFSDLKQYQQTSVDFRRKSVNRTSSKDYRFGSITVDWIDFGTSDGLDMSAPNQASTSSAAKTSSPLSSCPFASHELTNRDMTRRKYTECGVYPFKAYWNSRHILWDGHPGRRHHSLIPGERFTMGNRNLCCSG